MEAGFGQLFVVLAGEGWVAADDSLRVEVKAGDIVMFELAGLSRRLAVPATLTRFTAGRRVGGAW